MAKGCLRTMKICYICIKWTILLFRFLLYTFTRSISSVSNFSIACWHCIKAFSNFPMFCFCLSDNDMFCDVSMFSFDEDDGALSPFSTLTSVSTLTKAIRRFLSILCRSNCPKISRMQGNGFLGCSTNDSCFCRTNLANDRRVFGSGVW